jgi:hypothetical protein
MENWSKHKHLIQKVLISIVLPVLTSVMLSIKFMMAETTLKLSWRLSMHRMWKKQKFNTLLKQSFMRWSHKGLKIQSSTSIRCYLQLKLKKLVRFNLLTTQSTRLQRQKSLECWLQWSNGLLAMTSTLSKLNFSKDKESWTTTNLKGTSRSLSSILLTLTIKASHCKGPGCLRDKNAQKRAPTLISTTSLNRWSGLNEIIK